MILAGHDPFLTLHVLFPQLTSFGKLSIIEHVFETNISVFTSAEFPSSVIYSIFTPKKSSLDVMQPLPKHQFVGIFSRAIFSDSKTRSASS